MSPDTECPRPAHAGHDRRADAAPARPAPSRGAGSSAASTPCASLLVVAVLGSWELAARTVIDPFYYSMPSAIWDQLVAGSPTAPRRARSGEQIAVHARGGAARLRASACVAGVVLGIVLGRSRFLADVLRAVHQGRQRDPADRAGLAVRHLVRPRHVLQGRHRRSSWSSSRCSSTPSRAPARSTADPGGQRPDPRRRAAGTDAHGRHAQRHLVDPRQHALGFGFALIGAIVGEYIGADKGLGLLDQPRRRAPSTRPASTPGWSSPPCSPCVAEWLITLLEVRLTSWRPPASSQAAGL